jgi:hypothetical protein
MVAGAKAKTVTSLLPQPSVLATGGSCRSCHKDIIFEFRCQLSESFCQGWNVYQSLNFYRRDGFCYFLVFVSVDSAWKMASSCCKLWSGLACEVCSMCLTLCDWSYTYQTCLINSELKFNFIT